MSQSGSWYKRKFTYALKYRIMVTYIPVIGLEIPAVAKASSVAKAMADKLAGKHALTF